MVLHRQTQTSYFLHHVGIYKYYGIADKHTDILKVGERDVGQQNVWTLIKV